MTAATLIPAYGGGCMVRGARGRFVGVVRAGEDSRPVAEGFRIRDGRVFRVTVLPDGKVPAWACKVRPVGKSQHGKRGGYREGSREKWAQRASRMAVAA